jgi:glucose/mannose-6-phosphate isomerase
VPSGMQPRAAVIYMTVAALECAAACGAVPSLRGQVEAAAEDLSAVAGDPVQHAIAGALTNSLPVVHGAGPTAAPAKRWKTQFNENSNVAAFASELPEANHNEIEGWAWGATHGPLSAVFLDAPDLHPRVARRMELLGAQLEEGGVTVVRADARGSTRVANVLTLVMLGDLVSVHLAELLGVPATPVAAIEHFKANLD